MDKVYFDKYCEENTDLIEKFMNAARYEHDIVANQRYDKDCPYSYHLYSVFNFAKEYGHLAVESKNDILPILFAAVFHDSIEDARLTYNDVMKIAKKYMDDERALIATEIVYALTNEKGRTRAERANEKYYAGIRETKYAPFVKLCDRLANMTYSLEKKSSMAEKYLNEMNHFLCSIGQSNIPKEMLEYVESLYPKKK